MRLYEDTEAPEEASSEAFDHALAAEELQGELRDLLCLAVLGDHVRWVSSGDESAELSAWLAEAVPKWRAWADRAATLLASLGVPPDGRVRSLAKDIPVNWVPDGWLRPDQARRLVAYRLQSAVARARERRLQGGQTEAGQLLDWVCERLEAQARARAEVSLDASAAERVSRNAAVRAAMLRSRLGRSGRRPQAGAHVR